jgi:WD40 repeat protein
VTAVFAAFLPMRSVAAPVSYYNDIRPLIQRSCQGCHQPANKMGGLLLTEYEAMQKGGQKGPIFESGNAGASRIIGYLTGKEVPRMPMGGEPLPEAEINLFRQWIDEGAKDDTPDSEREPQIPTEPPTYTQAPVITAITYSPDGKLLAVGGYKEILLHNTDGSGIAARLLGISDRIHSLHFTAEGKRLVAVGGTPARFGEVQVWDVAARKLERSIKETNDTLFGGALSPDGTRVVFGCADKTVRMVEIATGKEIFKAGHHEDWVLDTAFGIDGKRIVSVGRDRAAKLADAADGAFLENVNFLRDLLFVVARHPRRDYVLIGGADRVPFLYTMDRPRALKIADDSTLIRKFDEQEGAILSLAFNADGSRIAVGGMSHSVPVYETETGKQAAKCDIGSEGIYALRFSPDGKTLATGGFDGHIRLFNAASGDLLRDFVPVPIEAKMTAAK